MLNCQWLFPLSETSAFNISAPVLTPDVIKAFRSQTDLQQNLRQSFLRMLGFYGLELKGSEVVRGRGFEIKAANWLSASNHNHLRITRILKSLTLFGLEAEAKAFFKWPFVLHAFSWVDSIERICPATFG
jgi:hypothetical protein